MECERYMKICVNIYDNDCVETALCNRSWLPNGWLSLILCPLNLPVMLEWTQGNFFIVVSMLYDLFEYNRIFTMFKKILLLSSSSLSSLSSVLMVLFPPVNFNGCSAKLLWPGISQLIIFGLFCKSLVMHFLTKN